MSYILDALKRSEQERHQEQLANLSTDMMLLPAKQNKSYVWPYLLIVVLMVNAGAYSYFSWNEKTAGFQEQESQVQKVQVQEVQADIKLINTNSGGSKPIPAHLAQKPVIEKVEIFEREDKYLNGGLLIEPKVKSETPVPPFHQNSQVINPRSDAENPAIIQAKPEGFNHVVSLSTLSTQFQRTIPTITFNSHIYSDIPSARRVMINNLYLREGESFSGMDVIEIGEFYVVLMKNQQQFKLPVLRDWRAP